MISFNIPPYTGKEEQYIHQAITNRKICGDGNFTKRCNKWLEDTTGTKKALLTTSCTSASDMAALMLDIQPGDEVIMPSFNFVSAANSFALRGAKIVFVDIRPDTMNIDETKIENAITEKTKVIVPVHYAGVGCEMDSILDIAKRNNLYVVEDAAQGLMSSYKGKSLGAIGDIGCYSFHETKNYSSGEGGAILVNQDSNDLAELAEMIREKGTDRSQFYRGQIDKYTWQVIGSSYLPSELCAAYLWAQLENAEKINNHRLKCYNLYKDQLLDLERKGYINLPVVPKECTHNAHMFFIKVENLEVRTNLIKFLKENEIDAVFHYVPLHTSPAGKKYGRFDGEDVYTTKESERLLRLPMHYELTEENVTHICKKVSEFFMN